MLTGENNDGFTQLYQHLPEVRLIIILREPFARAWSHYRFSVIYGPEKLSFEQAIAQEKICLSSGNYQDLVYYSYRLRGQYIEQILRYEKVFSKEQILVVFLEELTRNPKLVLSQIRSHIGLDPSLYINHDFSGSMKNKIEKFPRIAKLHQAVKKIIQNNSGTSFKERILRKFGKTLRQANLSTKLPSINENIKLRELEYYQGFNQQLADWIGRPLPW